MWQHAGPYAITNGRHHIAKLHVHGEPGYLLWLDGKLIHRNFTTSASARAYANEYERKDDVAHA
jgi:hypothetical protein